MVRATNYVARVECPSMYYYSLVRIDICQVEEVVAHRTETGQDLGEGCHDEVLAVTAINGNPR